METTLWRQGVFPRPQSSESSCDFNFERNCAISFPSYVSCNDGVRLHYWLLTVVIAFHRWQSITIVNWHFSFPSDVSCKSWLQISPHLWVGISTNIRFFAFASCNNYLQFCYIRAPCAKGISLWQHSFAPPLCVFTPVPSLFVLVRRFRKFVDDVGCMCFLGVLPSHPYLTKQLVTHPLHY